MKPLRSEDHLRLLTESSRPIGRRQGQIRGEARLEGQAVGETQGSNEQILVWISARSAKAETIEAVGEESGQGPQDLLVLEARCDLRGDGAAPCWARCTFFVCQVRPFFGAF